MQSKTNKLLGTIAALLMAATAAGCFDFFSDENLYLQAYPGTGGTGGTGGAPPGCIPQQTGDPIEDTCGVFVDAATGDDANGGTKEKPFARLTKALASSNGKPVYACADAAQPFVEAVTLDSSAQIFGGLDCTTWTYVAGTKTKWTAGADELPLRLADGASIAIEDVTIEAADAIKDGGSSIAIVAQAGASVELVRCDVRAGNGADGAAGNTPAGTGMAGVMGDSGKE